MDNTLKYKVAQLASAFAEDVKLRKALGDSHAEYHAQAPKVEAYKLLLDAGYGPKAAVEIFGKALEENT